jgi:uncharacterized zinc-type alcohol dehydrogenase-like protein
MRTTQAYGTTERGVVPTLCTIERRELRPDDVAVRVTHSGVCHSDLHAVDSHGGGSLLVPGHEFVGEVAAIGSDVTRFAIGDPVAVGNIVDSCGVCDMCLAGQENFCREFPTLTYGGRDRVDGSTTLGGYSNEYVVQEGFVYHRPAHLDAAGVAPLMCAGATVWEPMRRWNVGPGMRIGVVGLGGLGHLAVKLAHALGAHVTVFTTSAAKAEDARALGAHDVIVSSDDAAMAAVESSLDVVFDTVSVAHDLAPYVRSVARDGTLCVLGFLGELPVDTLALAIGHKSVSSGGSAGRPHTRELLDFCGEHGITADVEVVPSGQLAVAFERLRRNDVRYRFVLDMSDLVDAG